MAKRKRRVNNDSIPSVIAAIVGNLLIAVTKFVSFAFTGSSAMLSEGIHSVVDTGNGALMLWGVHKSRQPPDEEHPFGHGRELYFWSLIVAVSIFGVGGGVSLYEGILHISEPVTIESPVWSYATLIAAFVFEGTTWIFGWRAFSKDRKGKPLFEAIRSSKDPTSFTVLLEDTTALLGLVVAFIGVLLSSHFGFSRFDGVASVAIGLLMCAAALILGKETKSLLIGESVDKETVDGIRRIVESEAGVQTANKIRTIYLGPDDVALTLELRFEKGISAGNLRTAIRKIKHNVKEHYPFIIAVYYEVESIPDWNLGENSETA
ncbi:cation diffusion facilitator family transporter [soil metagenome]